MTKYDFDDWLRYRLSDLPAEEVDRIAAFYRDAIDDRMEEGMTEEEAIYDLGEPEALLEDIRADLPGPQTYRPVHQSTKRTNGKRRILTLFLAAAILGVSLPVLVLVLNFSPVRHEVIYEEVPIISEPIDQVPITLDEPTDGLFSMERINKISITAESAPIMVEPSYDGYLHIYTTPSCYRITQREGGVYVEPDPNYTDADKTIRVLIPADWSSYDLTINAQVGDVELNGITPLGLQVSLETGNIWLNSVSALEGIEVRTGIGGIIGSLSGSAADYMVEASVGTGSNNLGNTHAGHIRLWASVETGDIDVWFEE